MRDAFAALGHDAWSCDLLPTERPGNHIQGDAIDTMRSQKWDALITFPPCTRLCNSGVRWLEERNLWDEMREAVAFFNAFLNSDIPKIAVENPIQHGFARKHIVKYNQIIHPWQHGHGETKSTCLWLKGLPNLVPTNIVEGRTPRVHHESPGADRGKNRSRTFTGIAAAMAAQWSPLL